LRIFDVGTARDEQIAVGRVVKAHGIRGEIKVYPFSGKPENFRPYRQLILAGLGQDQPRVFAVEQSRPLGNLVLLQLAGLSGRDEAEALRGWEVCISKEMLPDLGPGDFYWHELEGLPVVTAEGGQLGRVSSLMRNKAHDILVITGAGGEYLIPAVSECVAGLAEDGKALLVTPPPGLLEMNAGGAEGDAG